MKSPLVWHRCAVIAFLVYAHGASATGEDIFIRTSEEGSVELSNVPVEQNFELFMAAPGTTSAGRPQTPLRPGSNSRRSRRALTARYRDMVAEAARRSDVDARLLHAVITIESGYNPRAVSARGAIGLMQLMPDTARRYCTCDVHDPLQNVLAGASYLHDLLKLFNNDISLALAAYNAGENAVLRYGSRIPPYRETAAYVPRVLAVFHQLEELAI